MPHRLKRFASIAFAVAFGSGPILGAIAQGSQDGGTPKVAPPFVRISSEIPAANSEVKVRLRRPAEGSAAKPGTKLEANVSRWDLGAQERNAPLAGGVVKTEAPLKHPRPARVGQEAYKLYLEKNHPKFALSASQEDPATVLEIKGHWDKSDRILDQLGIPHLTIGSGSIKDTPLDKTRVIIINCAGDLPRNALQPLRDFVARGGYLLTTDWALDGMLQQTFPGYVEWNGGKSKGNVVDAFLVDIEPSICNGTVSNASWKLDEESHTVRVLNKHAVRVLARSNELASLDPDRQGILALTFSFGRGRVLHLVGHFENNALPFFPKLLPDPAPVIGIGLRQAMATNFVVAGASSRR
ncbi:MAG TPA: hypothetical protein V6D17_10720 [Candidatus Obscuribacterales bacterium]